MTMTKIKQILEELAKATDGKIMDVVGPLPDGSGFATMSMPLPEGHWLMEEGHNEPPAPFRMGFNNQYRKIVTEDIRKAARYAIRASTMNGKEMDFDPDAMVQNFITGLLGYWTEDGFSKL